MVFQCFWTEDTSNMAENWLTRLDEDAAAVGTYMPTMLFLGRPIWRFLNTKLCRANASEYIEFKSPPPPPFVINNERIRFQMGKKMLQLWISQAKIGRLKNGTFFRAKSLEEGGGATHEPYAILIHFAGFYNHKSDPRTHFYNIYMIPYRRNCEDLIFACSHNYLISLLIGISIPTHKC